jgi:PTH2 family peptidyl-tRNA hydrolase
MRKGKMIAQGAHASLSFITKSLRSQFSGMKSGIKYWIVKKLFGKDAFVLNMDESSQRWCLGTFAKVCVRVDSREELFDIARKAKAAGLKMHVITDSGKTEFGGEPTTTCLAIGPDFADEIDEVTGHLKLL